MSNLLVTWLRSRPANSQLETEGLLICDVLHLGLIPGANSFPGKIRGEEIMMFGNSYQCSLFSQESPATDSVKAAHLCMRLIWMMLQILHS